jgi:hypothetical protein
MKLSRYIHGETHIDVKGALREIKAADAGMQSLLKAVQQREHTEAAKRAEIQKHTPPPAENSSPEWSMSKIPAWNKALRREVEQLMSVYYKEISYDDDYELTKLEQDMAKRDLDDIFSEIEAREKTEARLMKNLNASR